MAAVNFEVAATRVAGGTLRDELRAIRVVWKREMIRFLRAPARIVTSLAQPVIFLFILGTGLSPIVNAGGPAASGAGFDFRTFMFPGIVAMTLLFTSIFSAISIVWDREFGFLREMLVAPVSRASLVLGKCLGGATVATVQAGLMLVLAGFVHVPYAPLLLLTLLAEMALTAFALTAFGVLIAGRIQQVESFQVVMQFLVLPMFFLSGAVFPLNNLPGWLQALAVINPLSYAVDPMRRAVFSHVDISAAAARTLNPGITWGSWRLPAEVEIAMIAVAGLVLVTAAVYQFSRVD